MLLLQNNLYRIRLVQCAGIGLRQEVKPCRFVSVMSLRISGLMIVINQSIVYLGAVIGSDKS